MSWQKIRNCWNAPQGYKEVLRVALPLVISMGATTTMEFTDRVFLSHYSLDAIAAATPATLANLVPLLFFVGIVSYANVFIAQYCGSGRFKRVGYTLWQSLWIAGFATIVLASLWFFAPALFKLIGHPQPVQEMQVDYFRVLTLGSGFAVAAPALSSFFSGRGVTRPLIIVNFVAVGINIPLDYFLIFGIGPFPELGVIGAGLATVFGWIVQVVLLSYLIFSSKHEIDFAVWSGRSFDFSLCRRMLYYGLPAGLSLFCELFTVAFFVFMVGRIGEVELAASNIAFAINSIFFTPLLGFGLAASTLVGQALGRGDIAGASLATKRTLQLALLWTLTLSTIFLVSPRLFIDIFAPVEQAALQQFVYIREMTEVLLRFVVAYLFFDMVYIIFCGALNGAGDTYFILWMIFILGVVVLIAPLYYAVEFLGATIWASWWIITFYIMCLGCVAWLRYRSGKWKQMLVVNKD